MTDNDDSWQGVEAALNRFGLPANIADRSALVAALEEQIRLEANEIGDQFLMRLLCAQLFSLGTVEDVLLIWRAKQCNFDTHCGIDVALLCGAGLDVTKQFLETAKTAEACAALEYIRHCESCSNFAEFTVAGELAELRRFYQPHLPAE